MLTSNKRLKVLGKIKYEFDIALLIKEVLEIYLLEFFIYKCPGKSIEIILFRLLVFQVLPNRSKFQVTPITVHISFTVNGLRFQDVL